MAGLAQPANGRATRGRAARSPSGRRWRIGDSRRARWGGGGGTAGGGHSRRSSARRSRAPIDAGAQQAPAMPCPGAAGSVAMPTPKTTSPSARCMAPPPVPRRRWPRPIARAAHSAAPDGASAPRRPSTSDDGHADSNSAHAYGWPQVGRKVVMYPTTRGSPARGRPSSGRTRFLPASVRAGGAQGVARGQANCSIRATSARSSRRAGSITREDGSAVRTVITLLPPDSARRLARA